MAILLIIMALFWQPSGRYLTYKNKSTAWANYDMDVQL